jgi:thioredoxin 1
MGSGLLENKMSDKVMHVSDAEFEALVLNSDTPVLVDFWAEWCGPCKMIGPLVDEAAETYAGKVKVVKINIDHHQQTPRKYAVRGIPTLMLFKGGQVHSTQVGAVGKAQLAQFIDKAI